MTKNTEEDTKETVEEPLPEGEPTPIDHEEFSEDSEPETDESPESALLKRLDEAEEKAKENQEKYLRSVADLDNFRRRTARERDELRDFAVGSVVEDLLPAMDNLRLGLEAADNHPEAKDVAYGFQMVADQLKKTLEGYGLKESTPTGEDFDPNLHDCMAHEAHEEVPEGKVIKTVRPGYTLKKRLLRAASVIVSSGSPSEEDGGADSSAEES
ncbi:MAG: nucleotide exchange factor GrpE [Verrucomicrobiota bacterium]